MKRHHFLIALLLGYTILTILLGKLTGHWTEVIYFLTGVVILWYTAETHATRKVMADTFRLNLLEAYWSRQEVLGPQNRAGEMMRSGHRRMVASMLIKIFPELPDLIAEGLSSGASTPGTEPSPESAR